MSFRPSVVAVCTFFASFTITTGELNDAKTAEAHGTKPRFSRNICLTPECIVEASRILSSMNSSADPCDDFYEFACGNFVNSAEISNSEAMTSAFTAGFQEVELRLRKIIEHINELEAPKPFADIRTFYENCIKDEEWLDTESGLERWKEEVQNIGGWPLLSNDQWNDESFDYGFATNRLFRFHIDQDIANASNMVLELSIASPPIAWSYLNESISNDVVRAYFKFMTYVAQDLGAQKFQVFLDLLRILSFDIELYKVLFPNNEDRASYQQYYKTTVGDLDRMYPKLNLKKIAHKDDRYVVQTGIVPGTIERLEKWLYSKEKKDLANWIVWRWTASTAKYYGGSIARRADEMRRIVYGIEEDKAKWRECVHRLPSESKYLLTVLYHSQYLSQTVVNDTSELFARMKEQFSGLIEKAEWLGNKTKEHALEKISNIRSNIGGCREFILDDGSTTVHNDFESLGDLLANNKIDLNKIMDILHSNKSLSSVDKNDPVKCEDLAGFTGAYYFSRNYIVIGPSKYTEANYDIRRLKALNYGALGFTMGHELAHSLDAIGKHYDKNGIDRPWWDARSHEIYLERAACLVEQYKNYEIPELGLQLRSGPTECDDMADNVGVKVAYLAYEKWAKDHDPEEQLPGLDYSPKQMFWISMASSFCIKYRPESLRSRIYEDEHSPHKFRVNGALSNMPEFSKDFNCSPTSKMNPSRKCTMW